MSLPRLYAVLDDDVAGRFGWELEALAEACLAGGARLLQLRVKARSSLDFLKTAEKVAALAGRAGARLVVNDRADIARLAAAWGVHVGQDDVPVAAARAVAGPAIAVGVSTHTPDQIEAARHEPVAYVAVGPVFGTATKRTGYEAVGLDLIRRAADVVDVPVVGIGGITLERAASVIEAGAASVAVISDLFATGNPEARTRAFVERLGSAPPGAAERRV